MIKRSTSKWIAAMVVVCCLSACGVESEDRNVLIPLATNEGYIISGNMNGSKAVYVDVKGNVLLKDFKRIYPFHGGKYTIAKPDDSDEFVIIDRKGKMVVELDFEAAYFLTSFIDGMAVAKNGDRSGDGQTIINEKGKKMIDVEKVFVADDYFTTADKNYFRLNY